MSEQVAKDTNRCPHGSKRLSVDPDDVQKFVESQPGLAEESARSRKEIDAGDYTDVSGDDLRSMKATFSDADIETLYYEAQPSGVCVRAADEIKRLQAECNYWVRVAREIGQKHA